MKCLRCPSTSEGYAVIPGVGDAGEIRFYCDRCARSDRVRMRYWDGRDVAHAGAPGDPGGRPSFHTLIFAFDDLARMRREDLETALGWVDELELAAALGGSPEPFRRKILGALPPERAREVRAALREPIPGDIDPEEVRRKIAETVRNL